MNTGVARVGILIPIRVLVYEQSLRITDVVERKIRVTRLEEQSYCTS